jgi:hypothetical protein
MSNAAFDGWHRGAIIRVSDIVRKERKGRPAMVGRIISSGHRGDRSSLRDDLVRLRF